MIVLSKEACPGQSTNVNCKYYYFNLFYNFYGILVKNAEKPKSKVIPLYCDCGCLSKDAVDVI